MKCKDHLGNEFKSIKSMCEFYGVDYHNVYWRRLSRGWTLEDTLTKPLRGSTRGDKYYDLYAGKNGCCKDHLGNYYVNASNMCRCWGMMKYTFIYRMSCGWSVEKALTYGNDKKVPDKDEDIIWVFNEPFASYREVDNAYGYEYGVAINHKDELEKWITSHNLFRIDGKLFRSYSALSIEYGIMESCLIARISRGWTIEDAVHTPVMNRNNGVECSDHLGNRYRSLADMIRHYGLTQSQYRGRVRRGWSLEETLTTPGKMYMTKSTAIIGGGDCK